MMRPFRRIEGEELGGLAGPQEITEAEIEDFRRAADLSQQRQVTYRTIRKLGSLLSEAESLRPGGKARTMTLPEYTTPDELAKHLGWSARRVRSFARRLGVARALGNRIVLLPQDVVAIMEASRCPSSSISEAKSGTIAGRLPEGSYEDLQRLRARKRPNELPPTENNPPGKVISIRNRS